MDRLQIYHKYNREHIYIYNRAIFNLPEWFLFTGRVGYLTS